MASNKQELADLLSIVDPSLVFTVTKTGIVYLGGERADDARLANLKVEAEFLLNSDLWNILNHTIQQLTQKTMFVSGETLDDLKKGRSMLYLLDTQNKMLEALKSYSHPAKSA